jgi:hypothetical protein
MSGSNTSLPSRRTTFERRGQSISKPLSSSMLMVNALSDIASIYFETVRAAWYSPISPGCSGTTSSSSSYSSRVFALVPNQNSGQPERLSEHTLPSLVFRYQGSSEYILEVIVNGSLSLVLLLWFPVFSAHHLHPV